MRGIFEIISGAITNIVNTWEWVNLIDIALVAYVIYQLIMLVRHTRAGQLVKGILVLLFGYFLAMELGLKTTEFILDNVLQIGLLALIIVFQPELRRALEKVGRGKIGSLSLFSGRLTTERISVWHACIVAMCDSVERMSKNRVGALIVIERTTGLDEITATGTVIDASMSCELLETVFYVGTPLHDGAVILSEGRIKAAGCLLPLSTNVEISRDMGTRHRAALGMSENSDAMIVVVSEETGIVSLAQNGIIIRRLDRTNLFRILSSELMPEQRDMSAKQKSFWSKFGI